MRMLDSKRLWMSALLGAVIGLTLGLLMLTPGDDRGSNDWIRSGLGFGAVLSLGFTPIAWLVYPDVVSGFGRWRRIVASPQRRRTKLRNILLQSAYWVGFVLSGAVWYLLMFGSYDVDPSGRPVRLIAVVGLSALSPLILAALLVMAVSLWPIVLIGVLWASYGVVAALLGLIAWLLWLLLRAVVNSTQRPTAGGPTR